LIGVQHIQKVDIYNSFELVVDPVSGTLDSAFFEKQQDTTGAGGFAEGSRLSAKPLRPSAKALPRAALGKAASAKTRSAKPSLPRAVYRALGKGFAESQRSSRQRKDAVNGPAFFAESPFGWLSAKIFLFFSFFLKYLPRACQTGSRQRFFFFLKKICREPVLCRVQRSLRSAKLGNEYFCSFVAQLCRVQ
jgi:hypothetical protein